MTHDSDRITPLIWDAIAEVNELLPEDARVPLEENAVLLGKGGALDSFGLVNLVVALEQRIEDEFGISLTLADEKAMSYSRSPFRNVQTLRDYVQDLMNRATHA
ncbi:MAG TPA: acyl carrier protein [Pirellulales bacterium]|nr:acyl carrier protein [Pirellulales bacterium]